MAWIKQSFCCFIQNLLKVMTIKILFSYAFSWNKINLKDFSSEYSLLWQWLQLANDKACFESDFGSPPAEDCPIPAPVSRSSLEFLGAGTCLRKCLPISSQTCLMEFKSVSASKPHKSRDLNLVKISSNYSSSVGPCIIMHKSCVFSKNNHEWYSMVF